MKKVFLGTAICSLLALAVSAQTFEISGQQETPQKKGEQSKKKQKAAGSEEGGLGWGSSIEVSRMARAAEEAQRRGNFTAASEYARRAAEGAPQNTSLWFMWGYTARLAGHLQESVNAYSRGLRNQPGSPDGLAGLAQTYARMGRTDEAKKLLQQVLASHPERVNELQALGEIYIREGDTGKALQVLERAESQQPSSHSELLLAMGFMRLKQPDRARRMLERAKQRDPRNTDIFRAVANYYRETRDYDAAIETLKNTPNVKPDVMADLGYTYELAGRKQEAAESYARAAAGAPELISYQLSAAQAELNLGEMDKTKAFLEKAAALDPNHYRLHALRAQIARTQNRTEEAIREYNFALARVPEDVAEGKLYPIQLRLNLAELYKEAGNQAAPGQQMALAEKELSGLEVGPEGKAEFLRVRASIRTHAGDYAAAESDLKQAMALDARNIPTYLQYANLLWLTQRPQEARNAFGGVLKREPNNRFALEGLGYLAREHGDNKLAEEFFTRLAKANPDDYVGELALGDMFTQLGELDRAQEAYEKAYKVAPRNPYIVAGGANAAIEAHKFELAEAWIKRASGAMLDDPRVMRERERVALHRGRYLESAQLGYKVLEQLPKDRLGSVYLAYDLYNLGRYDEVLELVNRYEHIVTYEANFPLLAGHVHKLGGLLDNAVDDYARALQRDPKMVEAYVNRGYVLNDLQNAEAAQQDFEAALKLNPRNGSAHLGIAFSDLQLKRPKTALDHVDVAEKLLGESGSTHLARATGYRQERVLEKAEHEYRAALKYAPDDIRLHLALADTLYYAHHYSEALASLGEALRLEPDSPFVYAQMAHAHAKLGHRDDTFRYLEAAERTGADDQANVLLATGDALLTLGDREAAMQRFERALEAPDSNRVDARLAVARVFVREGAWDDARQQVGLAFAESRIGEAAPVTAENLIEAANIFLAIHDFDLAKKYFAKSRDLGAADEVAAIGLANAYLAQGDHVNAEAQLATLTSNSGFEQDYDYLMAKAEIYRQRHDDQRALSAFARANTLAGPDDIAEREMLEVAEDEGVRIKDRLTTLTSFTMTPIFEDATIYMVDAKLFGIKNAALLPPPRSSEETAATSIFRYRPEGFVPVTGFVQLRNARGEISLPHESKILRRSTYDTSLNGAINPVLRLGHNSIDLNTGLEFTLRRDSLSPADLNQNLFRQFLYFSTSSFANWLSVRGLAFHESGPFTLQPLNSRELGARLEFAVGRPWGKTALITGYSVRDLLFRPLVREFFTTGTYAGLQRKFFGEKLKLTVLGQYLRTWRVEDNRYALAQAMVPGGRFEFKPNHRWTIEGNGSFARGQGFHDYDNVQSGFFISYVRPLRRGLSDGAGSVPVEYPIRFSIGVQQDTFLNFTGRAQTLVRPVVRLTLF